MCKFVDDILRSKRMCSVVLWVIVIVPYCDFSSWYSWEASSRTLIRLEEPGYDHRMCREDNNAYLLSGKKCCDVPSPGIEPGPQGFPWEVRTLYPNR